jgi:hypothetical protein
MRVRFVLISFVLSVQSCTVPNLARGYAESSLRRIESLKRLPPSPTSLRVKLRRVERLRRAKESLKREPWIRLRPRATPKEFARHGG